MTNPELLSFFQDRIRSTFALDESQKEAILVHVASLSDEQMAQILDLVVVYEKRIENDSRSHMEAGDRASDMQAINQILDDLTF